MKVYVLVVALSTFFFSLNLLIFPLLRSFFRDFSAAFHKNYVFLLCNGILVFIVRNSAVSGSYSKSYAEEVVETENEFRGKGERELAVETREAEDIDEAEEIDGDEKERETENEDGKKQLEMAEEEEEEEEEEKGEMVSAEEEEEEEEERGEMVSAEELHRQCDDFIRRVKEAMRYESKQITIVG